MSELFLELFSEEIPAPLQSVARIKLIENIKNFFDKEKITYKGETNCFSTPNRLIVHFKNLNNEIIQKPEEIRGPNIKAPDKALKYQLFYQMTRITREKGSLAHDDRLDVLSMAVGYWVEQMARDVDEVMKSDKEDRFRKELEKFTDNVFGVPRKETSWIDLD